jgi:DNA-binding NarL/FixJ family response regulator
MLAAFRDIELIGEAYDIPDALQAPMVVFTMQADETCVRQALEAGAQGFLLKNVQPLALAQALRNIAAGQRVLAPEVISAALTPRSRDRQIDLTHREREVLTLLARGLSNSEIGLRLCVSKATVKFHCSQLFSKLGVRSRAQAIATAYTHNLVPWVVRERERAVTTHGAVPSRARARSA